MWSETFDFYLGINEGWKGMFVVFSVVNHSPSLLKGFQPRSRK